jgi:hypothetical protein
MRMRKGTIALFVALAFICSLGTAYAAAKGPASVTMKGATKGAVTFNHKLHSETQKIACKQCHHTGDVSKKCDTCHKAECKPGAKPICMKDAMHKNCIDCHKKQNKGPKMCNECHKK